MNAAETIQAAIDKLEAFRQSAVPGPWETYGDGILVGLTNDDGWDFVTGGEIPVGAARLIVTLHRTIDAQLAILRFGLKRQEAVDWTRRLAGDKQVWAASLELDLARAILGEAS